MVEDGLNNLNLSNQRAITAITDDTPIKFQVHNLTLAIYTQYKFHEIPSVGYLVMAEDGKSDEWTTPNQYPSTFRGG